MRFKIKKNNWAPWQTWFSYNIWVRFPRARPSLKDCMPRASLPCAHIRTIARTALENALEANVPKQLAVMRRPIRTFIAEHY